MLGARHQMTVLDRPGFRALLNYVLGNGAASFMEQRFILCLQRGLAALGGNRIE